ncbi:glycosyltransferase family 2 protein [Salinibacterium sp. ZJ77]|uniref:glycosyltransferase family 2 protein n=1 Tax=Salinibacterium sp. ZJ77 TaxID=2708337 RepID=UPI001421A400|nr:glycosyltransferase family 2 protein [Salinibacterium sp. ZJ77]
MTSTVAVITVTYNSSGVLEAFLDSIREGDVTEAIIVDNASSDLDQIRRIADAHDAAVLALPENQGYGAAMNAGAARAGDAEYLLLANPDVVFHEGAIAAMVERLAYDRRIGAVGPLILDANGNIYPSARRLPSLRIGIGHALFEPLWPDNPWTRTYRQELAEPIERDAGWLSGACLLVRRSAFEQIRGFDEGYFMYFEDVDLGRRLGEAGWRNVYTPDARVTHTGAHSTSNSKSAMARAHHRSAYRYVSQRYSAWYLAPLRLVLRVGIAVRELLTSR